MQQAASSSGSPFAARSLGIWAIAKQHTISVPENMAS
jgi:hypothetical protein